MWTSVDCHSSMKVSALALIEKNHAVTLTYSLHPNLHDLVLSKHQDGWERG